MAIARTIRPRAIDAAVTASAAPIRVVNRRKTTTNVMPMTIAITSSRDGSKVARSSVPVVLSRPANRKSDGSGAD